MSRTSQTQFATLVDFMEKNGDLNNWPNVSSRGREAAMSKWEELCRILNADGSGAARTVEKWKKVWSDYKNNTKRKAVKIQRAASGPGGRPRLGGPTRAPLTDLERRALILAGCPPGYFETNIEDVAVEDVAVESPKLLLVMQCCMRLIQAHGSVVERVIDDPDFQRILTLTPLTAEERLRVTSEEVKSGMDEEEEDCGETDTSEVQEEANETEIQEPREEIAKAASIKDEIGVIHWQCSCDEIAGRHDDACAAAAVDYLDHYRISLDEATCIICGDTLTWKSVATLRRHLQRQHPEVTVIGDHDDAEIPDPPPSPATIKLTKADPLDETPPANKKRKLDHDADNEPITTKQTTTSMDTFNNLNQFGLYVASLLKLLPAKKCIKYQNQIVDRLLKDLAAAA